MKLENIEQNLKKLEVEMKTKVFLLSSNNETKFKEELESLEKQIADVKKNNDVDEQTPLLGPQDSTKLQNFEKRLESLKKKYAAIPGIVEFYRQFKAGTKTKDTVVSSSSFNDKSSLISLPTDILRLIFENFSLYERQIFREVCKQFNTVISEMPILVEAVIFPIGDQKFVKFIEGHQQKNKDLVRSIYAAKRTLKPEMQEEIRMTVTNNVADFVNIGKRQPGPSFMSLDVQNCNRPTLFHGLFLGFTGIGSFILFSVAVMAPKSKATPILILIAVSILMIYCLRLLLPTSLWEKLSQCVGSAYTDCRYGRFFSSTPEPVWVEVYPQPTDVQIDLEAGNFKERDVTELPEMIRV